VDSGHQHSEPGKERLLHYGAIRTCQPLSQFGHMKWLGLSLILKKVQEFAFVNLHVTFSEPVTPRRPMAGYASIRMDPTLEEALRKTVPYETGHHGSRRPSQAKPHEIGGMLVAHLAIECVGVPIMAVDVEIDLVAAELARLLMRALYRGRAISVSPEAWIDQDITEPGDPHIGLRHQPDCADIIAGFGIPHEKKVIAVRVERTFKKRSHVAECLLLRICLRQ